MIEASSQTWSRSRPSLFLPAQLEQFSAILLSSLKLRHKFVQRELASGEGVTSQAITHIRYLVSFSTRAISHLYFTQGRLIRLFQNLQSRLIHLGVRNAVYKMIYDRAKPAKIRNDLAPSQKSLISGFAGALGAVASNGFSAQFIRKVADIGRPERFIRKDISYDFFAGLRFNIIRSFLLNFVMI